MLFNYEKSTHPEIKYSVSSILRVTGDEHQCLNSDLQYFEEARIKRKWVEENWDFCIKESDEWEKQYELSKKLEE